MNYSLIIGVEDYQTTRIPPVDYAVNDATEFQSVIENLGYTRSDSQLLLSSHATKTSIESRIRMISRSLRKDDRFIFYYVGHGVSISDRNYISCYDSVLGDLEATCIPIEHIFNSFKDVCNHVMFFIDSCHSGLPITDSMRGIYTDLNRQEFIDSLEGKTHCVGFAACKSDEKSYPISALKHGAWTYHLIEAFSGEAESALEKKSIITAVSLQNYLSRVVPISLKKALTSPVVQTPWIFGGFESDFIVGDIDEVLEKKNAIYPTVIDIELLHKNIGSIRHLTGFQRHHTVPKDKTRATEQFVLKITENDLREKIDRIFSTLRSDLNLKRKDISVSESEGQASLFTSAFTVHISIEQSDDDPSEFEEILRISQITNVETLGDEDFNRAFSKSFSCLVLKMNNPISVNDFIDAIEELESEEIMISYPHSCQSCTLSVKGTDCDVHVEGDEIRVERTICVEPRKILQSLLSVNKKLIDSKCSALLLEQ